MKKTIFFLALIFVFSCSNSEPELEINVGCKNQITVNKKEVNIKELTGLIKKHYSNYKSKSQFKVIACEETAVNVLVEIRDVIKSVKSK